MENKDYIDILDKKLKERIQRNCRYSIRAFAKDLGISHSVLIQTLGRKHRLSLKNAKKILTVLELTNVEREVFWISLQQAYVRTNHSKSLARKRLYKGQKLTFTQIKQEYIEVIGKWYHQAILELTYLSNFQGNISWIASALNLAEQDVKDAVARLLRLELLEIRNDGRWYDVNAWAKLGDDIPSEPIRNAHCDLAMKGRMAIDQQGVNQRKTSSSILSINPEDLEWAEKILADARDKITTTLDSNPRKKAVYCLHLNLFELAPGVQNV